MGLSHILFLPKGLLSLHLSPERALMHRHDIKTLANPTSHPDSTQQKTEWGPRTPAVSDHLPTRTEASPHLSNQNSHTSVY